MTLQRKPELLRVTSTNWLGRLTQRLGLRVSRPGPVYLDTTLYCFMDISELLRFSKVKTATVDISAGSVVAFTVPDGKRWRLLFVNRAATVNAVRIFVGDAVTSIGIVAPVIAEVATAFDLPLEQKGTVTVGGGAGTDTAVVITILYTEEDAY